MNPASGRSYEDELCGASQPRGVAVLGDSISAHFHLPREWFNSTELSLVYPHTTLPQAMVRSTSSSLHLGEDHTHWPWFATMIHQMIVLFLKSA